MTRPGVQCAVGLAMALCLAACTPGVSAPRTSQGGPLTIGSDNDGPTGNHICGPLPKKGAEVNFAGTIVNPTKNPARILDVELVDPVNTTAESVRAWDRRKSDGEVYWSDQQSAGDKGYAKLFSVLEPAVGYVVDPGQAAGVAVQATVTSTGDDVTVGRLLISYELDGTEYAELTDVDYDLKPDGCGP